MRGVDRGQRRQRERAERAQAAREHGARAHAHEPHGALAARLGRHAHPLRDELEHVGQLQAAVVRDAQLPPEVRVERGHEARELHAQVRRVAQQLHRLRTHTPVSDVRLTSLPYFAFIHF